MGGGGAAEVPALAGATLAGVAHAMGVWPGASRVGLSAAVLLALGVRPARAVEIALVATAPFWLRDFVGSASAEGGLGKGQTLVAGLFAFFATMGAVAALRALAARRALAMPALWMIALAGALFAYARAA
ncbi:MAG: hypothetical protein R3B70_24765 [Polyangiaceae bacterium]